MFFFVPFALDRYQRVPVFSLRLGLHLRGRDQRVPLPVSSRQNWTPLSRRQVSRSGPNKHVKHAQSFLTETRLAAEKRKHCSVNGQVTLDGAAWEDDCNTCQCSSGKVVCTKVCLNKLWQQTIQFGPTPLFTGETGRGESGYRSEGCARGCVLFSAVGRAKLDHNNILRFRVELLWECQILYGVDTVCFKKKHNGAIINRCQVPNAETPTVELD